MSDIKEDTLKKLAESAEKEKKRKEVADKELILKERRVNNELERIVKNDKELELAKSTSYGVITDEQISQIQKDSREYIEAARRRMLFINNTFDGVIPYFRKNLILIGGKTGEGKSTTVANIVATTIKQTNVSTGKRCKALVITNEEKTEDVYNRITCFAKGWHYVNHDKFTDEQIKIFENYIPILAKDGWLKVIDDSHGSTPDAPITGVTTSLEGIQGIFDGLIKDGVHYDVVIIDYYQNVNKSKKNPGLANWQVQEQLAALLDQYKNIYPAPIVLMAQVSPPNEDNTVPFKVRIEGRKSILNVCTACVEMIADRENLRTEWFIHKSRFNESVGTSILTGYDKGRFVPYNPEFQNKVTLMKERKMANDQDKLIGIQADKKKDDKNTQP